jgi:transposase
MEGGGELMSRVVSNFRRARAVELALAGHSYDQIAEQIGYSNRGTAWRVVQRALRDREAEAVDVYREVELARLDALQSACWESACAGDRQAVDTVLRIIEKRARLMGIWDNRASGPLTEPCRLVQEHR